jgi:hypothetical protein
MDLILSLNNISLNYNKVLFYCLCANEIIDDCEFYSY